MLPGIRNPILDPNGWRGCGDALETIRMGGCPKREQSAERVAAKDDRLGPISFFKIRYQRRKNKIQRFLRVFPASGSRDMFPSGQGIRSTIQSSNSIAESRNGTLDSSEIIENSDSRESFSCLADGWIRIQEGVSGPKSRQFLPAICVSEP